MSVQKSQAASSNRSQWHANDLYQLMIEVRTLRDKMRSLEVGSEAKTPDRTALYPAPRRGGEIENYPK